VYVEKVIFYYIDIPGFVHVHIFTAKDKEKAAMEIPGRFLKSALMK